MTDLFGNYKTQTTLALQSIQSSKYPDTNKDFEANVRRLNEFVDYIAQYLQTMQKGVDQANQDPITQIRTTVLDIGSLLGGGEILYGIDLGDLQYYLPALGAMFGFDAAQPFPINLLYAAEHFFAGFIVPLDAWAPAVEDVIDGWAIALGLNPEFIASVHDLLDAIQGITSDFTLLFNTIGDVLSIFGVTGGDTTLFGQIWHSVTVLLGSLSLKDLGAATDPIFKALAPWIEDIAIAVSDLDQIIKSFSGGVTDLAGILNFASIFTGIIPNFNIPSITTDPLSAWATIFAQAFQPLQYFGDLGTLFGGLLGSTNIVGAANALFSRLTAALIPVLDATKITTGQFASQQLQPLINSIATGFGGSTGLNFSGLTSLLSGLPGAQQLTDAISNALGHPGTGHTATDVFGYLGLIPGANIASAVSASVVPALDASKITTGLLAAARIASLPASQITSGIFGTAQIPNLPASIINSGSFLAAQIPNLDASKITTGQFAQSFLNITSIAAGIVTGTLGVGQIPSLPAGQITSGIFGTGLIPSLDASKITTGTFADTYLPGLGTLRDSIGQAIYGGALSYTAAQVKTALGVIPGANIASAVAAAIIPAHDASKITSGIFGTAQIPALDAAKITTGTFLSSLIPSLPASIITTGIFPAAQIPALDATKITSGILALAQIPGIDVTRVPSLPASQITSGIFGAGLIPSLDASKVTTGTFAQSMVSGLPAALASMLTATSPINAQYLFNQVPSSLLGMVPYSHIGNASPNLIAASSFDNAASVTSNPGWGWDGTDGYTTNGCASATANGSLLQLVSNIIQVAPGQTLNIGARAKYLGLTATAGQNAIQIVVAQYLGSIPGATTMIASIASPSGNSAGFVQVSGNYTVPASGVDNIVVQLVVTQAATAGTVKYDDAFAYKTGLMSGTWMSGISGTVAADIQSAVDQIFQATQGGASTGNALSTIKNNLLNIPGPNIISALGAGVIPGLDASKIITGALSLLRIPSLPTSQITSGTFLASLIPTLDASKIASGVMALAQIPTNLLNKGNISDIQTMSDQLTNALIGTGSTYSATDIVTQARPSMDAIYNNVMNAVNSLQALRSQSTATNISGVNVNINFQNYADGPLPSNFTVTYSGPGTSTIGVSGGVAGFTNLVNNGNRRAFIVWNSGPTNTDFQIVRGTMSSPPSGSGSGGQPYIYAMGRVDNPANPQNFVWARAYCTGFLTYKADLGYTVAGVETIMLGNVGLTWSLDINVLFGANANPRRYQAYSGTQLVFDYIESGTNSKLGAGYRYWGCVAQMVTGSGGAVSPGGIAATSVSDNAPPNVLGSTFRASRHNTATVNYANSGAGAPVKIAANFFDTQDWISPDMTWDGTNLTVNTEGTYLCVLRLNTNSIPGNTKFTPVIYQNNVAEAMVGGAFADGSFSAQSEGGTGAGAIIYVKAGDVFAAGTAASGGGTLTGDSLGMSSYFEMALLNRSMQ